MIESPPSPCPDASVLDAYVQGSAEPERRSQLETHLDVCTECRRVVAVLLDAPERESGALAQTLESHSGDAASQGLTPGQVLLGKYEVETLLGAGGMGIVARARHRVLDRPVVIKLLKTPHASEEAVRRFLREARAAAAIDSPNVVRVIDAGLLDAARPYLVLEHLEGRDLAVELAERGVLPVTEAVELALQCAEALVLAHARGIVHRDIKPANLFIARDDDGRPLLKVLDFGIAKALSDSAIATDEGSLTHTSDVIGSPRYMSPEQLLDSSQVDVRADIWALGAVLYELVSGKPAFDAPNLAVLATKILTQPFKPVSDVAPEVPPEVEAVIVRCLQKDRELRFASASDLAAALLVLVSPHDASRAARLRSQRPSSPIESTKRKRTVPAFIWVVGAIGIVAVLGLVLQRRAPQAEDSPRLPEPVESSKPAATARDMSLPSASIDLAPSATAPSPELPPRPPTHFSPRPRASSIPAKPAASGVNVLSDGFLDRK